MVRLQSIGVGPIVLLQSIVESLRHDVVLLNIGAGTRCSDGGNSSSYSSNSSGAADGGSYDGGGTEGVPLCRWLSRGARKF